MRSDMPTSDPSHRTSSLSEIGGELVNTKNVSICCFTDTVQDYSDNSAEVVAVDVIRATTTAITAISTGRECHFAATLEAAFATASKLPDALLAGELGGEMPDGFHMTNSPAQLAARRDVSRPLVLLSSSGTRLMHELRDSASAYVACFRNYSATVDYLAQNHNAVVLIGAGTRGEFREEDQMCCAWIAAGLIESGFVPDNWATRELVQRWRGAPKDAFLKSRSVDYLRRSGQLQDLEFILSHFDDIDTACKLSNDEISPVTVAAEV
jgi:2-phosphosulfolactate phosphatase